MRDLQRFVDAQAGTYATALAELRAGQKRSHWMWFVFPQIAGLGHSHMAREYAVDSLEEARAYLAHPILGARLRECVDVLARRAGLGHGGARARGDRRRQAALVAHAVRARGARRGAVRRRDHPVVRRRVRRRDRRAATLGGMVTLDVLVQPRASRAKLGPMHDGRLKIAVTSPPVDGEANAAVIEAIAAALGIGRRAVEVTAGATSRRKTLRIDGVTPEQLAALLARVGA